MLDPFERLGVRRNASAVQIRKSYLNLVRKWHPDRFQEGPERLFAEKNMIEINIAYEEAVLKRSGVSDADFDGETLKRAQKLMEMGELTAARRALTGATTRCAEWNYLFGAVLLRLGDIEKAALYFGVAARQRPEVGAYKSAQSGALSILRSKRPMSLFRRN